MLDDDEKDGFVAVNMKFCAMDADEGEHEGDRNEQRDGRDDGFSGDCLILCTEQP